MYSNYDTMLTYKGHAVVDYAKKNPVIGDVCLKDNKVFIYYGSKKGWTHVEPISPSEPIYYTDFQPRKLKRRTCLACGAPLHGLVCEYCGSEYEYC